MASRRKKRAGGKKRSAEKRSASVSSTRVVGVSRAKAAGIRKTGERFFDRSGKRLSTQVAQKRVARHESKAKKPAAKKPAAKKPVAKKPIASKLFASKLFAKKQVAKKPVAKKPVAKKPVAKKPIAKKLVAKRFEHVEPKRPERKRPQPKKAPPARRLHRDDDGRFITHAENKRIATERRIASKFRKEREIEGRKRREEFALPVSVHNKLCREVENVSKRVRKSNRSLSAETTCSSSGAVFDAMIEISGLPSALVVNWEGDFEPNEEAMRQTRKVILDALLEVQKGIKKRRGLLIAVTLQPIETLLLLYGRDQPVMTTRWMQADDPEDIKNLVMRCKKMLRGLWAGQWEVERLQIKFRYDHEVARRGYKTGPDDD